MKAAIVALGLYRSSGGPSRSVRAFADALRADVISWVDPAEAAQEELIWDRSTVVTGSRLPLLRQLLVPQPGGLAAAESVVRASDVISCHSFWRWHAVWLERTASRHRVPYWFVPHGGLDPYVFEHGRLFKNVFLSCFGRRFLDHAAAVVCATKREHDKLESLMPGKRAAVIPWPLAPSDFRTSDPTARRAVRRRLDIPDESVVFLLFGRLDPMKRPLETIAMFAAAARADSHMLVVGPESGVSREQCERTARAHGVGGRVHVVGGSYGPDRTAYLDAADVYVSLSRRENFNYTATEAMASGLPVILSPGNDLGPDIAHVGCGWVLEAGDEPEAAIAEASATAHADLAAMGGRGRAWAEAHLRADQFASRVRTLAAEITASR